MGHEIKRVPLDFDWPQGKPWQGYLNPHYMPCPDCKAGFSDSYEALAEHIRPMVWDDRVIARPSARAVLEFLAGREPEPPFGYDSLAAMHAVLKVGSLAGLPERWETCPTCEGHAIHPEYRDRYLSWERTDPPEGDGYQVWETVSEGSPVSPVMERPSAVVDWLVGQGYTRDGAETFVRGGWAPSMMLGPDGIKGGVDSMADLSDR